MANRYLLFDVSSVCHWCFYSQIGGIVSGKNVYKHPYLRSFFKKLIDIAELFRSRKLVFCFDSGVSKRKEIYSGYKASRKKDKEAWTEEKLEQYLRFKDDCELLREKVLRYLGYANLFSQEGYEADDVIASVCENTLGPRDKAVIISDDQDFFQLLSSNVFLYRVKPFEHRSPRVTADDFSRMYGISPTQWADVKAMAGCKSDEIPGLKGIGEKTACSFLGGTLPPKWSRFKTIVEGRTAWEANLCLTKLPFPGVETFEFKKNKLSMKRWKEVARRLELEDLNYRILVPRSLREK